MANPNVKNAVVHILSDARGIYIPRDFLTDNYNEIAWCHCESWGLNEENKEFWVDAANPESEWYWDSWQWVMNNARYICEDGSVYFLHHDGDLWGLCVEKMTSEQKYNFGYDE